MSKSPRIAVAMSGGVDSSVAAALLKMQGAQVFGLMLRLWSEAGTEDTNRCCTPESVALARRAAAQLEIPFYTVDARSAFHEIVVQGFLDGYGAGMTPNPCLQCNRQIRWSLLLDHALAMGADRMATGHYARMRQDADGTYRLLRAQDRTKDQSYVLHVLNQDQLARALFPVGELTKTEVRAIASRMSLPSSDRRDSQDLCFLAGGDYRDFILRHRPEMLVPGEIVDAKGRVLGLHEGLARYTIGQRKGIRGGSAMPLYVMEKQPLRNRLIVGARSELGRHRLTAADVRWVDGVARRSAFAAEVKTRYTAREQRAIVTPSRMGNEVTVEFEQSQVDITPGQAAVFYEGEVVAGGGVIQAVAGQGE